MASSVTRMSFRGSVPAWRPVSARKRQAGYARNRVRMLEPFLAGVLRCLLAFAVAYAVSVPIRHVNQLLHDAVHGQSGGQRAMPQR